MQHFQQLYKLISVEQEVCLPVQVHETVLLCTVRDSSAEEVSPPGGFFGLASFIQSLSAFKRGDLCWEVGTHPLPQQREGAVQGSHYPRRRIGSFAIKYPQPISTAYFKNEQGVNYSRFSGAKKNGYWLSEVRLGPGEQSQSTVHIIWSE